jgi:hypothetical protein
MPSLPDAGSMGDRPTAATLGSQSLGVWPRADALTVYSRHVVQRLVVEGTWQSPFRGVYADGGYQLTAEQLAWAAVLSTGSTMGTGAEVPAAGRDGPQPSVVACGRDAARVWGLPLIDDDDPATGSAEHLHHDVHTAAGLARRVSNARPLVDEELPPGSADEKRRILTPHRLDLTADDYVRRPSGLWVTTPLRTAWDCSFILKPEAHVCLLDRALQRALFTPADLLRAAISRAGVPGVRRFRAAIALADGRAEAPTETLARLLLLPVIPSLTPQVRVHDRYGRVVARLDLGDEHAKLAVELDGKRGHSGDAMVAKDRQRDRRTEVYGWWTERGTWYDVRVRQGEFVDRVVARHCSLLKRAA